MSAHLGENVIQYVRVWQNFTVTFEKIDSEVDVETFLSFVFCVCVDFQNPFKFLSQMNPVGILVKFRESHSDDNHLQTLQTCGRRLAASGLEVRPSCPILTAEMNTSVILDIQWTLKMQVINLLYFLCSLYSWWYKRLGRNTNTVSKIVTGIFSYKSQVTKEKHAINCFRSGSTTTERIQKDLQKSFP